MKILEAINLNEDKVVRTIHIKGTFQELTNALENKWIIVPKRKRIITMEITEEERDEIVKIKKRQQ